MPPIVPAGIASAMSRFPVQWPGNKRKEAGRVLPHIPAGCRTLVEPFAGSAAISIAHWEASADRGACRYVFGDADPGLCSFVLALRAEGLAPFMDWARERLTPEAFAAIDEADPGGDSPRAWFYRRKVRRGRFDPKRGLPRKWPTLGIAPAHLVGEAFFRSSRLEVVNADWGAVVAMHAGDPSAAIYLDPPYFGAYNQGYYDRNRLAVPEGEAGGGGEAYGHRSLVTETGDIIDGTRLFVEIARLMRAAAATVILSTNGLAILTELYAPWVREVYAHRYSFAVKCRDGQTRGKMARHLLAVKVATRLPTDEELAEVLAGLGL